MKRTISVLLVFSLLLLLSSCSVLHILERVADNAQKTDTPVSETDSSVEEEETSAVTETPAAEEDTYEMGTTTGGVYTNTFLKIGCTLDNNWTYYNEDQLAELSGLVADAIGDEAISKAFADCLESGKVVYDIYASTTDNLATISVLFENLGVVYGMTMDESKYVDYALDSAKQALSSTGIENITCEKTSAELAGATRTAVRVTGDYSGVTIYEVVVCIKQGNYMAVITLCSINEDVTEYLASLFYSI